MKKRALVLGVLLAAGTGATWWCWESGRHPTAVGQAAPQLVLYTGENFTGRSLVIRGSLLDFPLEEDPDGSFFDWNDKVRSLVVSGGTWRLYQHGRCNTRLDDTALELLDLRVQDPVEGWSALVSATATGELQVPNLAALGLGPDLSSVELISEENLPAWTQVLRSP